MPHQNQIQGEIAVGIDPNDCIYPIAMGVAEVECTSSWEWFLTTLRDDLNITNTSELEREAPQQEADSTVRGRGRVKKRSAEPSSSQPAKTTRACKSYKTGFV